ncbi:helix-turn-helix domain-containing protein [Sulfobacillus harzensis]|uniref:Helix-turn-helix transcriptional regulator n=1 Tax=Sulfobacillus harzensis TaxID=2729629 RepID=A0A7Y0Q516_9FIRM|nr:helix-turn-helix transcriptional regulator [Sulfobacillus harzensis]NMP23794.1 helix-turn-helix transcriptional regulator [Sulfobacillus harzensis]
MRKTYMRQLKAWRERRGLSQADLGRLAGYSDAFISMLERGKKYGSLDTLERLATALNVNTDQLLADTDSIPDAPRGAHAAEAK